MAIYDRSFGGYRIFIGDLGSRVGKYELERELEYYGPLLDVWVARNPPGFAFMVYKYPEDAEKAARELNGRILCGRRVRVEHARPYEPRRSRGPPGQRGGGHGGPPPRRTSRKSRSRSRDRRRRKSRSRSHSRSRSRSGDRRRSRERKRSTSDKKDKRSSDKRKSGSKSKERSRSKSKDQPGSLSPTLENHKVLDEVKASPEPEEKVTNGEGAAPTEETEEKVKVEGEEPPAAEATEEKQTEQEQEEEVKDEVKEEEEKVAEESEEKE